MWGLQCNCEAIYGLSEHSMKAQSVRQFRSAHFSLSVSHVSQPAVLGAACCRRNTGSVERGWI